MGGNGLVTRALCGGAAILWMLLTAPAVFPPAAALALNYHDSSPSSSYIFALFPAVAGCVVILAFGHLYFGLWEALKSGLNKRKRKKE